VVSSRRRHTRSKRDWSSDVCSSDLHALIRQTQRSTLKQVPSFAMHEGKRDRHYPQKLPSRAPASVDGRPLAPKFPKTPGIGANRSEERRVGKESRDEWSTMSRSERT